jgi:hypothetical protein
MKPPVVLLPGMLSARHMLHHARDGEGRAPWETAEVAKRYRGAWGKEGRRARAPPPARVGIRTPRRRSAPAMASESEIRGDCRQGGQAPARRIPRGSMLDSARGRGLGGSPMGSKGGTDWWGVGGALPTSRAGLGWLGGGIKLTCWRRRECATREEENHREPSQEPRRTPSLRDTRNYPSEDR